MLFRSEDNINVDMIVQNVSEDGKTTDLTFTVTKADLERARQALEGARNVIEYRDIVFAVSVGNEATVDWTDHLVPVERLISFVRRIREEVDVPITFCENYVPWVGKLEPLAAELDFLSVHTYPVWEYRRVEDGMAYSIENLRHVANHYPDKPVIITEAGWTTNSNGRGIEETNVCEDRQKQYYEELIEWSQEEKVLTFVFEAFDELWKGSDDDMEPEKHWGLFTIDRKPKRVMRPYYPGLANDALRHD